MKITSMITAAKMGLKAPIEQALPNYMKSAAAPKINNQLRQNIAHYTKIYRPGK